jgi:hypothetical protein
MKKILLVILILGFTTSSFSQNFLFYRISPAVVVGDTSSFLATSTKGIFKNISSVSQSFKFIRVVNNLPPGWTSSLCVGINCYSSTADTVPPPGAPQIILSPNQQDTLTIDVYGQTIGLGTIVIKCFTLSNPSQYIVDTFKVQLGSPSSIHRISSEVKGYELFQNYPNPFNPVTNIKFSLAKGTNVSLDVFDLTGRKVATLLDNVRLMEGSYTVDFNAENFGLGSGVYYYRLNAGEFTQTRKMVLLK